MCKRCGKCCKLYCEVYPGIDDVPEEMTENIEEEDGRIVTYMKQNSLGYCVAFSSSEGCTIYSRRPIECRYFRTKLDSRCSLYIDKD